MAQNMKGEETVVIDDSSIAAITAAVPSIADVTAIKADLETPSTGLVAVVGNLVPAIGALVTAADHMVPLAESGPQALDAAGGVAPTHLFAIPLDAKSFSVGSVNAARTGSLAGFSAPSNSPRTKSGEITTLSDAGFIPAFLDDGATAPTHVHCQNTDLVAGWVWVQWYK